MDAAEPTNIIWENLSKKYQDLKQFIMIVITLGLSLSAYYVIKIFTSY